MINLQQFLIKNKKQLICYSVVLILLVIGVSIVFNNYNWYNKTISKIVTVKNSYDHKETDDDGHVETYFKQNIVAIVMNKKYKDSKVHLVNIYSSSKVYDNKYSVGDELFTTIKASDSNNLTGSISGLKLDKYIAILSAILIMLILLVSKKRGILTIFSLIINIFIFWFAIDMYKKGTNILFLSNCMVIIFTSVSLLLTSGIKRSTFIAIISTLLSVLITMIIFKICMATTKGVDYAFMEYLTNANDLAEIFMSQMLIGGLGAVMDVSITIASTINELVTQDKDIPINKLIQSGREVSYDIMGTMINVMLFTFICGSFPLIILMMNSHISLITIILWHMPMELYRFLIGSIGILITIPVSLLVSILIFKTFRRQTV